MGARRKIPVRATHWPAFIRPPLVCHYLITDSIVLQGLETETSLLLQGEPSPAELRGRREGVLLWRCPGDGHE